MCVAEGAIRSGKTIDHCIIAQMYLETCKDKIHLASGSSMPNAKLNIGDCNGFGLEHLFRGRCRWGKYKGNEALYIYTKTGEKIVIFVGGGKKNSYQKILGNSYGLWIATEIIEHFDSDVSSESFIKVAFGRQTAADKPFTLWDLNPGNPKHRIYVDYIDKYKNDNLEGYLYEHFTMRDNLSISKERMEYLINKYDVNSVWYKRDVLGKRCVADGLCYVTFANNYKNYLTNTPDYDYIQAGVDFGGNKSAHTFVASGLKYDGSKLTALACEKHEAKGVDPDKLYDSLVMFIEKVEYKYGNIESIFCDSTEQTLISGIRVRIKKTIRDSIKNEINNRIKAANSLISQCRFYYTEDCDTLVEALETAIYDPKKIEDVRLDNGTSDIDTLDAWEYSWENRITLYARAGFNKKWK